MVVANPAKIAVGNPLSHPVLQLRSSALLVVLAELKSPSPERMLDGHVRLAPSPTLQAMFDVLTTSAAAYELEFAEQSHRAQGDSQKALTPNWRRRITRCRSLSRTLVF